MSSFFSGIQIVELSYHQHILHAYLEFRLFCLLQYIPCDGWNKGLIATTKNPQIVQEKMIISLKDFGFDYDVMRPKSSQGGLFGGAHLVARFDNNLQRRPTFCHHTKIRRLRKDTQRMLHAVPVRGANFRQIRIFFEHCSKGGGVKPMFKKYVANFV